MLRAGGKEHVVIARRQFAWRLTCALALLALILLMISMAPPTSAAASDWIRQTSGTTSPLRGVAAADGSHAWAVGGHGLILHTSNAGASWHRQFSPSSAALQDVACADRNNAWAVGNKGTVLHTSNGGATWVRQRQVNGEVVCAVTCASPSRAWAVISYSSALGGTALLRTTNGGATWQRRRMGTDALYDVYFINQNKGWCVGTYEYLGSTTNGGVTWEDGGWGGNANYTGVAFADALHGWVVGEWHCPRYTADGGLTWSLQPTPHGSYNDIACSSANVAWAVDLGQIAHTSDGGTTWTRQSYPSSLGSLLDLRRVACAGNRAWAVAANGVILRTR